MRKFFIPTDGILLLPLTREDRGQRTPLKKRTSSGIVVE